jgi:hypothetical protein
LTGGRIFCTVGGGFADGFRCDVDGRIWSTAGDGVEIFAPDGHLIGKILMGSSRPNNLCFGGPQYKTLFTVGRPNVCSLPVRVAGAVSIHKLSIRTNGSSYKVTWPAPSSGFALQETAQLTSSSAWTNTNRLLTTNDGQISVNVEATNPASFFRLRSN